MPKPKKRNKGRRKFKKRRKNLPLSSYDFGSIHSIINEDDMYENKRSRARPRKSFDEMMNEPITPIKEVCGVSHRKNLMGFNGHDIHK